MLQEIIYFLGKLKDNNNKTWFDQHRSEYKQLESEFKLWVGDLILNVAKFDPLMKNLNPNDCTYRINRDVRFSNNKEPYKTWMSAVFSGIKKNGSRPGYYFQVNANHSLDVGGGWYDVEPTILFKFRQKISKDPASLEKIINQKDFKKEFGGLTGEKLKTTPKGFDPHDLAIELLRHKNYITMSTENLANLNDGETKDLILNKFRTLEPLVTWLRQDMG
jgi:uncharacterized protein (TIGR02453 family)